MYYSGDIKENRGVTYEALCFWTRTRVAWFALAHDV